MRNNNLNGTGVALITPFNDDYSIDFDSLANLIEHLIGNHIDYFVVMGTTGESVSLSYEEQNLIIDFVKSKVNNRVPIVVGLGGNNTLELLRRIDQLDFNGIEAILSVCPYYNKPSQQGIFNHYREIAKKSPVDIIMYNVPSRTALNIDVETIVSLSTNYRNIIGVKEASGDIAQCMELLLQCPSDFMIISGDDKMTFPIMALGGVGVISVQAMAFPELFSKMINSLLDKDVASAQKFHYELLKSVDLFYIDGNPSCVKEALFLQGICNSSQVRLPLVKMTQDNSDKLRVFLSK